MTIILTDRTARSLMNPHAKIKVMARGRRKGPVYRDLPKDKIPTPVKRVAASGLVLFILLISAGIAYTYFYSGEVQPSAVTAPQQSDFISQIKPRQPAANAKESASIESFSSLAQLGSETSIDVKTLPGSKCTIQLLYYNTTPAEDPALSPKIADEFGTVDWSWTIGPATPVGMWPVNITCSLGAKSAFVQTHLSISK